MSSVLEHQLLDRTRGGRWGDREQLLDWQEGLSVADFEDIEVGADGVAVAVVGDGAEVVVLDEDDLDTLMMPKRPLGESHQQQQRQQRDQLNQRMRVRRRRKRESHLSEVSVDLTNMEDPLGASMGRS
jgi:hypothetical protein